MVRVFGRIGMLSFGGPAAQIALMHRELVEARPWLSEAEYLRALSLCMLLPGPEAMQLATYAGWRLRGRLGGLLAGALFVLPGAAVIALLVMLYVSFGTLPVVQAAFTGVKAAVIVIVLQALLKLMGKALTGGLAWAIALVAFVAIFAFDLPFPVIILAAGVAGFARLPAPAAPRTAPAAAQGHPLRTLAIWLPVWLGPLAALSLWGSELLAAIGWFFAWLAVVTFGGAYAVLAYMTQTVVSDFGWLSTAQMIDALGLAETTPGPLILVTQFVAMVTGALQGGAGLALAAGGVALWATFVPCFLWIFMAAPYLDHIAARPRLGAAMQGISAAVVGVILNLSVWFALHVLFARVDTLHLPPLSLPVPDWRSLDPIALMLTVLACGLILGLKQGLARSLAVLAICGAATVML